MDGKHVESIADRVLSNYVSACAGVEDDVGEGEVRKILDDGFSVEDVRDYFLRVRNPAVYRSEIFRDLLFPFDIDSVEGGSLVGHLRKPFFDVCGKYESLKFNPCSLRSAIEREIFVRVPREGEGIIVASFLGTIADFLVEEEIVRYDDIYGRDKTLLSC
jgi:hypothetical protein